MGVVQMNSNPLAKDFNTGSLLKFAFPTISMMLFMGLYTIVDTIFVSRFVNTNALSAINIVCPVINLIVGLGTMIATGGSESSPNLCVHSSSSYVSPSMLPLSSGDLIKWSLVCHSTLSYQKFCDRHSNHYDHPEELHQSVE